MAVDKMREVPLVARFVASVEERHGQLPDQRLIYEVNRRLITEMVQDLVTETSARIARLKPKSADDVREAGQPMVGFSPHMTREIAELRAFLFSEFYLHPRIKTIMSGAQKVVSDLYAYFTVNPDKLPESWRKAAAEGEPERVISDFVAGMTDRLAMETHRGLFDDTPRLR
jgi:dGTPase